MSISTNSAVQFPDDFAFGVSTAAYQIEGAATAGGRGPSIWDTFAHSPGRVIDGSTGDVAIDHYHRLDEDLDHVASLGVQAYRFSISWSRVQPTGEGPFNDEGLAFYSRLIDGLLERGIAPYATLYHWDLPQALEDAYGGWLARETAEAFGRYAAGVGRSLGDRVAVWATINEPWCIAFLGYGTGEYAPGRIDAAESLRVAHHLNLAHGLGVKALRETITRTDAKIGVVLNPVYAEASGDRGEEAVRRIDAVSNRIFTGPMLHGSYPDDLFADTAAITDWSFIRAGDAEVIHQPIDLLGINYYTFIRVRLTDEPAAPAGVATVHPGSSHVEVVPSDAPTTTYGWPIEPDGLERLLLSLAEQFPALPLFVAENGAAMPDAVVEGPHGRRIDDVDRIDYLARHLSAVHRARE
ncbi:MAG TPA: family 1 glycosylhydrolase, partial [Pseudolysinimonas sp.]|nr:family 1 glycosylhydrolase [Pseudolysinimonas sp.]